MNIVGTPYRAVHASLSTASRHAPGVEGLPRDYDGGPVGHEGNVPQDHAEAVIERHWEAYAVDGGKAQALAYEEAVVEDVVVREGRPLRKSRRAGRVLDVDGVVELEGGLPVR